MTTSSKGLALIKEFEGCKLTAYQDSVGVWTIGYGHTGSDVYKGLTITQSKADSLLASDLKKFEGYVSKYVTSFTPNQNQFDALVSFTYNCGVANLKTLTGGRTASTVAQKILLYNKAGGKVLAGLTRRRKAEQELFLTATDTTTSSTTTRRTLRKGSRGDDVTDLQKLLNDAGYNCGKVDGKFGEKTLAAVEAFQDAVGLKVDGIVGPKTWAKLE